MFNFSHNFTMISKLYNCDEENIWPENKGSPCKGQENRACVTCIISGYLMFEEVIAFVSSN